MAQLQSNLEVQPESSLPVDSSAKSKITLHTVQLESVTVQQDLRQPIDSSARVNMIQLDPATVQQDSRQPADSSARVK